VKIQFEENKKFVCPDCGFVYYHNTAAATGCIISVPDTSNAGGVAGERIMLLVRGKEPAKGKLDLPGGFVDPGEGAFEGLRRELREEIGWVPPDAAPFTLFASFPNIYPYRNIVYNTCDLFFTIDAPDLTEADLALEAAEIGGVQFIKPADINLDDLAFESTKRAIGAWLENLVLKV
jgi:ADP-ribose pyrophosphatase YjhB (NUDIX family)